MRKTKIIGTIGPASNSYEVMKKLVSAGLNIVRINLSHAKIEDMEKILKNVKRIRKEMKVPLPIMIDTRGPEVRVKTFANDSVNIKKGQEFIFTGRDIVGDERSVSFNTSEIVKCIKAGNKILAVNGLLTFKVLEVKGQDVITKAMNSGVLSNRKSLSIPNVKYSTPYLNNLDKQDILWGIKNDVELIAASFVNCKEDVFALRSFIEKNGGIYENSYYNEEDKNIQHHPVSCFRRGICRVQDLCRSDDGPYASCYFRRRRSHPGQRRGSAGEAARGREGGGQQGRRCDRFACRAGSVGV